MKIEIWYKACIDFKSGSYEVDNFVDKQQRHHKKWHDVEIEVWRGNPAIPPAVTFESEDLQQLKDAADEVINFMRKKNIKILEE